MVSNEKYMSYKGQIEKLVSDAEQLISELEGLCKEEMQDPHKKECCEWVYEKHFSTYGMGSNKEVLQGSLNRLYANLSSALNHIKLEHPMKLVLGPSLLGSSVVTYVEEEDLALTDDVWVCPICGSSVYVNLSKCPCGHTTMECRCSDR